MTEKGPKKRRTLGKIWGEAKEKMGEILRKGEDFRVRNERMAVEEERIQLQEEMHQAFLEEKAKAKPELMGEIWGRLKEKYPQLEQQTYAVLGLDDPDAYYFLENCSLQTLKELGIVSPRGHFTYLNVPRNWQIAIKNNPKMKQYRDALFGVPDEDLNLERLFHEVRLGIEDVRKHLLREERAFGSEFSVALDPKVMMAIFINEIAPDHIGRKGHKLNGFPEQVKFTQKARIEIYRMMIEAGWQPQKMPAQNVVDNVNKTKSFGIDQFTKRTSDGLFQKAYKRPEWNKKGGSYIDGLIPREFEEQVSLQDQVKRSLLLTYANLRIFDNTVDSYKPKWRKPFLKAAMKATAEQKMRFSIAIVAAMHNKGARASLVRKAIKKMMTGKYKDLDGARELFLGYMNRAARTALYTKRTAKLYDSLKMIEVYNELSSWDPENGVDFENPRRTFDRELDAVKLKDLGLPTTYMPAPTETLHVPSGPEDWDYFPRKNFNGFDVLYVPVKYEYFDAERMLRKGVDMDLFEEFQDESGYFHIPLGDVRPTIKNANYLAQLR
jgi:hypothetical protein